MFLLLVLQDLCEPSAASIAEVEDCVAENARAVPQQPYGSVASVAKQATNLTSDVVVVDVSDGSLPPRVGESDWVVADCALVLVGIEEGEDLLEREAVPSSLLPPTPSEGDPWLAVVGLGCGQSRLSILPVAISFTSPQLRSDSRVFPSQSSLLCPHPPVGWVFCLLVIAS